MFEIMDANQEALNIAHSEKQELESLWMQAKDELKHTKKVGGGERCLSHDTAWLLIVPLPISYPA